MTIIRDDSTVGIDGVFRIVDVASLPAGVRAVQWKGTIGEAEHDVGINTPIDSIAAYQTIIDLWTAAEPVPFVPSDAQRIAAAQLRIANAYDAAVQAMTAGYSPEEISSWPKQETEARAWLLDSTKATPWTDAAASARSLTKSLFVTKVIANADAFAPVHGQLTGKRQKLRDQITALGASPTQAQLDAIQW